MLRLWLLATCLSLLCCGSPQRSPVPSRANIEEIRALIAEDRLDEAEQRLLALGNGSQASPARDRLLGHIAVRRGNVRRALSLLTPLRKPGSPDPWLDWDLAQAHIMDRNHFAAIDLLAPLIEAPPAPVAQQLRMAAGEVALEVGDNDLALQSFGFALAGRPEDGRAFLGLARATFRSGSVEEAELLVSARVARFPDELEARLLLGEIRAALNRIEDAAAVFAEITRLASERHEAWRGLGFAQFRLGRLEAAVKSLERARRGLPDDPSIATKLGQAYAELGRNKEAVEALLVAAKASPDSPEVWRSLIAVQLESGDAYAAVQVTRRVPKFLTDGDPQLEEACYGARLIGAALLLACGEKPSILSEGGRRSDDFVTMRVPLDELVGRIEELGGAWRGADLGPFDPVRAEQMLRLPPIREAIRNAARYCLTSPPASPHTAYRPQRAVH